ncbi:MAG: glycogen synthase GlgA [Verrucomicrobiales bacterium]|jgi:starch synthase|nr:glycogen synthase GlgA [Verrucomicrobiales bacterium]
MNILFAASELTPYAKTGGLGDVLAALPAALRARGHSVAVALPLYRQLRESAAELRRTPLTLTVALGGRPLSAPVWQGTTRDGVTLFAIERDEFFDRGQLYGTADGDYFDNAARFIFYSQAVVALALTLAPRPQIIHANDWQAALIPALVRAGQLPFKTALTVHNLAYQGIFPAAEFALTGLPGFYLKPHALEYYGRMNLLKGGILLADVLTTVSAGYAREILTEPHGCGLDGALRTRAGALTGILNGIDTERWNPATDPLLAAPYDARRVTTGKRRNKLALLEELGLPLTLVERPLLAVISRLVEQKGIALILRALPLLVERGAGLVVLGAGEAAYAAELRDWARRCPRQVSVSVGFDERLAHRIEAAADIFLMPSRFEPCGLNQLYSMRYGTVPVVHKVGGLADSVADGATGFTFSDYTAEEFLRVIVSALELYPHAKKWQVLRLAGMRQDFSWSRRVPEYEKIYAQLTGTA